MFFGRQEEISQLEEIAAKVQRLQVAKGVSIRTALVYDGKLSPQIEAEHGFDVLIPIRRLIKL